MPLLNLKDADLKGFEALPAGTYHCSVFKMTTEETKGGEGAKLPKGTSQINVQFKVMGRVGDTIGEDSEYWNRRLFRRYTIPPAKGIDGKAYDKSKAAKMKGMIVRLFMALGLSEDQVVSESFDPDFEDMVGRECYVTAKQKPKYGGEDGELDNEVTGVKPVGEGGTTSSGLL